MPNSYHLEAKTKARGARILTWLDMFSVGQSPWKSLKVDLWTLHKNWRLKHLVNTSRILIHARITLTQYLILHAQGSFLRASWGESVAERAMFWSCWCHNKSLNHEYTAYIMCEYFVNIAYTVWMLPAYSLKTAWKHWLDSVQVTPQLSTGYILPI